MPKKEFVEKLVSILIRQESVNQKEAESMKKDFYNRSKEAFDFFLIDGGLVSKENVLKALSEYYEVPAVDVVGIFFDHDLVRNFPKDVLLEYTFIPREIDQDILIVVANDPADPKVLDKVEEFTSYTAEFQVGLKQDITDSIREFYDEPPEGYIRDTTDDDEPDEYGEEEVDIDELVEKERW